jgi:hypothetical protein
VGKGALGAVPTIFESVVFTLNGGHAHRARIRAAPLALPTLRTGLKTIRSATYAVKKPQPRIGGRRYLLALDSAQGC